MADQQRLTLFAEQELAALGAIFTNGHIPRGELAAFTGGGVVIFTAIEYSLIATGLDQHLAAAVGAKNVKLLGLLLGEVTFGITGAGKEEP